MTGVHLPVDNTNIKLQTERSLSGLVNVNGTIVNVKTTLDLTSASGQKGVATVLVVPDTSGVTRSGRAETDKIGGSKVTVGAAGSDKASERTMAHEFGHVAGAGDQYAGGLSVNGTTLSADVPGDPNIMKILDDVSANDQTLREIIDSKSNTNSCAPGIHAASGGC